MQWVDSFDHLRPLRKKRANQPAEWYKEDPTANPTLGRDAGNPIENPARINVTRPQTDHQRAPRKT